MNIFQNRFFQAFVLPLSLVSERLIALRNRLYDNGRIKSQRLDARVISVGNITVGGTGKTPVVEYLAQLLSKRGKTVGILSRGYRRKSRGTVLVSDGTRILTDPLRAGDEPYLLARRLKGVPVIVDNNRYRGGKFALERFQIDYFILDDGFQHRQLWRDLDILLIDASRPFGYGRVLPAGLLREPLGNMERAQLIWLTRVDQTDALSEVMTEIRRHTSAPIVTSLHKPKRLINPNTSTILKLRDVKGRRAIAFTGIGNPSSFQKTLLRLGIELMDFLIYPDHYLYNNRDLDKIKSRFKRSGAELIITTEKDHLRLLSNEWKDLPLFFLDIQVELVEGRETLEQKLLGGLTYAERED